VGVKDPAVELNQLTLFCKLNMYLAEGKNTKKFSFSPVLRQRHNTISPTLNGIIPEIHDKQEQ
jgi:hypothetical protein